MSPVVTIGRFYSTRPLSSASFSLLAIPASRRDGVSVRVKSNAQVRSLFLDGLGLQALVAVHLRFFFCNAGDFWETWIFHANSKERLNSSITTGKFRSCISSMNCTIGLRAARAVKDSPNFRVEEAPGGGDRRCPVPGRKPCPGRKADRDVLDERVRPRPRGRNYRRAIANFWQIFGKMSLVFGCIGTDFCKKIRVLQHFSKSTR